MFRGIPVGKVGYVDNNDGTVHLDWYVDPSYRGQGIGSDAVKQMIQHLDAMDQFDQYEAMIRFGNTASFKLARRCGFEVHHRTLQNVHLRREAKK